MTGLPAAGKSAVSAVFRGLGAELADADQLVGEALDRPRVARAVIRILGPAVRGPGGRLDRAAAAALAFGPDPAPLRRLEALVHPIVKRGLRDAVAGARRRRAPAVVLDVPLLFERGVDRMCDFTVFVRAARPVRLARARRRGWTAAELRRRERRQLSAAERRRRADFTVDNGGTRTATRDQVRALWRRTIGERRAR